MKVGFVERLIKYISMIDFRLKLKKLIQTKCFLLFDFYNDFCHFLGFLSKEYNRTKDMILLAQLLCQRFRYSENISIEWLYGKCSQMINFLQPFRVFNILIHLISHVNDLTHTLNREKGRIERIAQHPLNVFQLIQLLSVVALNKMVNAQKTLLIYTFLFAYLDFFYSFYLYSCDGSSDNFVIFRNHFT